MLAAIGFDRRQAREVVRLSFSAETTSGEAADAAVAIVEEAQALRGMAPKGAAPR